MTQKHPFAMDIFCSGLEVIVASYLEEVVIYGCKHCHCDALMLICCSCSHRTAHTCAELHMHTHKYTRSEGGCGGR